jgi:hypothetical protein
VTGFRPIAIFGNNGADSSLESLVGDGDPQDTSSLIITYDTNNRFHAREVEVNGLLDTNWVLTLGAGARPVITAQSISGLGSIIAPAIEPGIFPTFPTHSAASITGGRCNFLVLRAVIIRGSQVANPPVAPTGHTLIHQAASRTDLPADTVSVTVAVAQRTYSAGDLEWTAGEATVPSAVWGGLADAETNVQPWRTMTLLMRPA